MRKLLPLTLICSGIALAGCSTQPELQNQITPEMRAADYPQLLPLDQALSPLPSPQSENERLQKHLDARGNTLQRRAERLRRQPI